MIIETFRETQRDFSVIERCRLWFALCGVYHPARGTSRPSGPTFCVLEGLEMPDILDCGMYATQQYYGAEPMRLSLKVKTKGGLCTLVQVFPTVDSSTSTVHAWYKLMVKLCAYVTHP